MKQTYYLTPVAKPRMTQRDRWKKRPVVEKYYVYKDTLRILSKGIDLPDTFIAVFHMPMPKSWSKKKKGAMDGKPHQQKPDVDNLVKALMDCLAPEGDEKVWGVMAFKYWTSDPRVDLEEMPSSILDRYQTPH